MKKLVGLAFVLILALSTVFADEGHPEHGWFEQAEAIINAELPCESLSEEQLEYVGEYYMEQMHPGEAHERMDEKMGGEGSESLRQTHIRMAKSFYCGESGMIGSVKNGDRMHKMNGFGMNLLWFVYATMAAFVFSIIFWWTYRIIIKK